MKKRVLSLIIIGCVIGAILIAVGICAIIANSRNDNSVPCDDLSNWQSMIRDGTFLKNVAIPGAHDAGTKGLPYFAETQDRSISDLLACGTRYFDLRVAYANGDLKIYHGPSKGVKLDQVLTDIRLFVTEHPTENVILDFQHFDEKETEAQEGALKAVKEKLNGLLIVNDTEMSDAEFIDTLAIGQTRGKCLVVWGRETPSVLAENFVFLRNNDAGTRPNSVIHSYYQSSLNKKSSKEYIKTALPQYIDEYKKVNSGLFVLQGQLTDGLFVFGPHLREATHTDNMNEYVDNLQTYERLDILNIIMRDFVSPKKNCLTLKLNSAKGIVEAQYTERYASMLGNPTK